MARKVYIVVLFRLRVVLMTKQVRFPGLVAWPLGNKAIESFSGLPCDL